MDSAQSSGQKRALPPMKSLYDRDFFGAINNTKVRKLACDKIIVRLWKYINWVLSQFQYQQPFNHPLPFPELRLQKLPFHVLGIRTRGFQSLSFRYFLFMFGF